MSVFRQILFSVIIFALVPPAVVHGGSTETATYVGGSVKSIPINIIGLLDVSERGDLQFEYGTATFKVPCSQVTSTAIVQGETRHLFRRIPVPSLMPGRKKETLTINYKDASGANGTMNFELSSSQAATLLEVIALKKSTPPAASTIASDDWWGDKYWKTNRNKPTWDGPVAPATQTAQANQ